MRRIAFLAILACCLAGCQAARTSIETGAYGTFSALGPAIEKIDLSVKYKTEW